GYFPCLMLARLLTSQGVTVTFVVTEEELATKLKESERRSGSPEAHDSIRYATIAYEPPSKTPTDFFQTFKMGYSLRSGFEALLHKLTSSPVGVTCIIIDCFVPWGWKVASDFKIPAFAFYTTNAHALTVMLHARSLIPHGLTVPHRVIEGIPGLSPLQVCDLPRSIHTLPSFSMNLSEDLRNAAGVILNTVLELEKEPLEFVSCKIPFYAIGPMRLVLGAECFGGLHGANHRTEERECLDWLGTRPHASVLFVAFGSWVNMNCNQVRELAEGLEASGQAFLWVNRSNDTLLPEDFMERTKDRGLMITWAPQVEVSSHSAIGGFITHCGWNSLTENLSQRAVPMICWPHLAEQRLNKRLLVNKWNVGLELRDEDGVVKKTELEKVIIDVMQGEIGKEPWKRALRLKELILSAVEERGSSQRYLKALGEEIRHLGSGVTAE
ncbi:hypothetical protein GOP47_0021256, partial [Adiantum capillus-veneris]